MENARRYIDKAKRIAGNQFYTGYAINIAHRSMHRQLTEDLDTFARRGAAYRGHMGRELVLLLANELVRTGHLKEAKQTLKYLEEPEDVQGCMRTIAMSQARHGQIEAALETIDQLPDAQAKNVARLGVAESLCETGKSDTARKLADFVLSSLQKQQNIDQLQERNYQSLAQLYGRLGCQPQLEQLVALASTPQLRADCIWHAVRGFALARAD
jgi:thioredoxin-like negative regulator of GroEL